MTKSSTKCDQNGRNIASIIACRYSCQFLLDSGESSYDAPNKNPPMETVRAINQAALEAAVASMALSSVASSVMLFLRSTVSTNSSLPILGSIDDFSEYIVADV